MIVFDIETGGLDKDRHAIIQFAGIAVDDDWSTTDSLEIKIKFRLENAEAEALEINSYDPETWKAEAHPPAEAARTIATFCRRHVQKVSKRGRLYSVAQGCGHNSHSFDGPFLGAWMRRLGVFCPLAIYETLDTLHLARWHFLITGGPRPDNYQLGTLCEYFDIEHGDAHDALGDVVATAQLAKLLTNELDQGPRSIAARSTPSPLL